MSPTSMPAATFLAQLPRTIFAGPEYRMCLHPMGPRHELSDDGWPKACMTS